MKVSSDYVEATGADVFDVLFDDTSEAAVAARTARAQEATRRHDDLCIELRRFTNALNSAIRERMGVQFMPAGGRRIEGTDGKTRQRQKLYAAIDVTDGKVPWPLCGQLADMFAAELRATCPGATAIGHTGADPVLMLGDNFDSVAVRLRRTEEGVDVAEVRFGCYFAPMNGDAPGEPHKENA